MIREIFSKDYFVFSFDLKSGFITWVFSHQHRKYLAFSWDFGGNQTRSDFQFTVLLFSISSACAIYFYEVI